MRMPRRHLATAAWVLFGTICVMLTIAFTHGPDGPLNWVPDQAIEKLSPRSSAQSRKVVLVYVTDATLKDLPYIAPVDRQVLADVVKAVDQADAAVIGLDFIFDRKSEQPKDEALIAALRQAQAKVVLGALDDRSPPGSADLGWQSEFFERARPAELGHLYFDEARQTFARSDHVVRSIAAAGPRDLYRKSFAEALAAAAGSNAPLPTRTIAWLLPSRSGDDVFLTLSADDLLGAGANLPLKQLLGGKIVIIAGDFPDRDQHFTPLSYETQYPGAFIHAQALAQILDGRSLFAPTGVGQIATGAAFFLLGIWLGRREIADRYHRAIETTAVICLVVLSILSFALFSVLLPVTAIFIGGTLGIAAGHYSMRKHI